MADREDALVGRNYRQGLVEELDRLLAKHPAMNPYLVSGMLMLAGIAMLMGWSIARTGSGSTALPQWSYIAWPIACLLLAGVMGYRTRNYEQQVASKLSNSGLIARLALGYSELPRIHDYVTWPWNYFVGAEPQSLRDWVRLVASQLDWYLDEPRRLLRMQWLANLLGYIVMGIMLAFMPVNLGITGGGPAAVFRIWASFQPIVMVFLLLGILGAFDNARRVANIRLLRGELQKL